MVALTGTNKTSTKGFSRLFYSLLSISCTYHHKRFHSKMAKIIPDGLDNLRQHNLLTYKSHQEALDSWAIDELLGHYVNYRKQESPSPPQPNKPKKKKKLLPETYFKLYAVCTRYPHKLAKKHSLDY